MNTFLTFLKSRRFLMVVGVIVAVLVVIEFGYPVYRDWRFDRELQQLTDEINKPYLEDTYGGETPKETLEMFIVAVENGDYELASKYFVISKQEEWKNALIKAKDVNKLGILIDEIKKAVKEIEKDGQDWATKKNYIAHTFVLLEFIKYPQGIWKIKEI